MVAFAAVLFAGIRYALDVRAQQLREQTGSRFREVMLGLMSYNDAYGCMPPPVTTGGGSALYSWRLTVWPFIRTHGYYDRIAWDQPWDSPANQAFLRANVWPVYNHTDQGFSTFVLAVTGPGTAFGESSLNREALSECDVDTIVLIEYRDSGLPWPKPGDADILEIGSHYKSRNRRAPSSIHGDGFHVAFADGDVWFLSDDTPFDVLKQFLTIEGAKSHDRDVTLAQYRR